MSTPMVVANLNGTKTETRRIVKHGMDISEMTFSGFRDDQAYFGDTDKMHWGTKIKFYVGDILWCRETTCFVMREHGADLLQGMDSQTVYKASIHSDWMEYAKEKYGYKWTPSLFMPKSACRLFLEIVDVRIERLNDISEQDAINEGVQPCFDELSMEDRCQNYNNPSNKRFPLVHVVGYKKLWEQLNGRGSWKENPWVWVVKYKRIDKPLNFK